MGAIVPRSLHICANCHNTIPPTTKIDGKRVSLNHRVYCLECSPIGTRRFYRSKSHKPLHTCQFCGKEYTGGHGKRKDRCDNCTTQVRRNQMKRRIIEYLGGACAMCGYNKCQAVLYCHHTNGQEKEFRVSSRQTAKWETLASELDKCILLCANCQSERIATALQEKSTGKSYAVVKSRRKKKLQVVEYLGGVCIVCGYNKYAGALHCHHLDRETKEFGVSTYRITKWETLTPELDKCVLLCANCHAEYHAGIITLAS